MDIRTVGHLCERKLITVDVEDSILEAAEKMTYGRVGALAVLDDGALIGIISEADVVCAVVERAPIESTPIGQYMTETPITVSVDDDAALAARYMLEHGIGHLPVIDSREPVGMITRGDLLAIGAVPLARTA